MNPVRLNLLDFDRAIHGTIQADLVASIVAALSAGPTTIGELESAMARFVEPRAGTGLFTSFGIGTREEPCDGGIACIDLSARLAAMELAGTPPGPSGFVYYHNGNQKTDIRIWYCVPDDWMLVDTMVAYQGIRELRKQQIASSPPLDARSVLYGAVVDYIIQECLAAREAGLSNPVVDIHARWLMTPRPDLQGQSPRSVMLRQREFIDEDMRSREDQWARLGKPAPCLSPDSAAYRFGGFGSHEIIVYYDLVRFLISSCWERTRKRRTTVIADEAERLHRLKAKWLARPEKSFDNKNAAYVIECERKRLPLVASNDDDMFFDDCPFCKAMKNMNTPGFWHFDSSFMEDDFPFSFYLTREEWEAERQLMGGPVEDHANGMKAFDTQEADTGLLPRESCQKIH